MNVYGDTSPFDKNEAKEEHVKDRTEMTLSGDKSLLIENGAKERQNRSKQELL